MCSQLSCNCFDWALGCIPELWVLKDSNYSFVMMSSTASGLPNLVIRPSEIALWIRVTTAWEVVAVASHIREALAKAGFLWVCQDSFGRSFAAHRHAQSWSPISVNPLHTNNKTRYVIIEYKTASNQTVVVDY